MTMQSVARRSAPYITKLIVGLFYEALHDISEKLLSEVLLYMVGSDFQTMKSKLM